MGSEFLIVLDTHAWIWWLTNPGRLGKRALRLIEKADRIGIPAIAVWEIAMKSAAGKLRFDRPYRAWVEAALAQDPRIELLHLSASVSMTAAELSWDHSDPADRMIVATAREHEAALVTADTRMHEAKLVRCVWD